MFKPKPTNNKKIKSKNAASVHEEAKHVVPNPKASPAPAASVVPSPTPANTPQMNTNKIPKQPESSEKRGRSSSVPSNNRNKNAAAPQPAVQKSKNSVAPQPTSTASSPSSSVATPPVSNPTPQTTTKKATEIVPPISTTAVSSSTAPTTTVWQPRSHNKPLVKASVTPLLQQTSSRPQPPVGKILPEVRRVPVEVEHPVLPKPIGYRQVRDKPTTPPSAWNTDTNPPWFNVVANPPSAPSGAWWPDGGSPLGRNLPVAQHEPSRDWLGLSTLASDYNESSASNNVIGSHMWPINSYQTSEVVPEVWSDVQQNPSPLHNHTVNPNPNPVSRVYSPWSVPPWLDVTQQRRSQQDPMLHHNPITNTSVSHQSTLNQGILPANNNLWDPSARNPMPGNESSWSTYSQF